MNKTKKLLLVGLATFSLAGCFGEEATVSKDYYITHSEDQANKMTWCNQHPEVQKSPNCVNAYAAEEIVGQGTDAIAAYMKKHGLSGRYIKN